MDRSLPRFLWALSIVVLIIGSVMTLVGAWTTSASLDEAFHVQRMQHYLDDGWFLIDRQMVDGQPAEGVSDRFVYGPVTMALLHGLAVLWGVDGSGVVSASSEAYAVRHLGIAIIGLIGVAATVCIGRLVLRNWGWGAFAGAVLVSTPLWTGHSMMNPKDVSVATGYSLLTLGLVALASWRSPTLRRRATNTLLISTGIILAMGTRPGIWAGVAASVVAFVVVQTLVELGLELGDRQWSKFFELIFAVCTAGIVLAFVYPSIFANPLNVIVKSTSASSHYEGAVGGAWWYIPIAVAVSVPVFVISVSLIGAGVATRSVVRAIAHPTLRTTCLILILVQAFVLPVVAMMLEAKLYNGVRHLLFVTPAIAILATMGVQALFAAKSNRPRMYSIVVTTLVSVGVLAPIVDQVRLFPYNYTYFNEVAQLAGIEGQTDWWWTSARNLARDLPRSEYVSCVRKLDPQGLAQPQWIDLETSCATSGAGTLAPYASERAGVIEPPLSELEFLGVSTEVFDEPKNCRVLHEVTRPVGWGEAVMGRIARCELRPPTYEDPIDLPAEPDEVSMLDGWLLPKPGESGIVLESGRGRVAIAVPGEWSGEPVSVSLGVSGTEALADLRVNGVEQTWTLADGGDRIDIEISPDVAAEFGDGRLVFSFVRSDADAAKALRLLSLELIVGPR